MDKLLKDILGQNWGRLRTSPYEVPEDYKPTIKPVLAKKQIGIEVEVENVRGIVDYDALLWGTKEDGSLRNNGVEFVTFPISGKQIEIAVTGLFKVLPKNADFSERTSIHVHLNMRDASVDTLLNLLLLYITFEKSLYKFAGGERYRNIFCVPLQETKLPITVANFLANNDLPNLISQWPKYSGLNLHPLFILGTVEFRQMKGHRDPTVLLRWINLIFRMHKYASKYSFQEVFNYIRTLNTTSKYEEFRDVVFESDAVLLSESLRQDMEPGVSAIKVISLPSGFVGSLISELDNNSALLQKLGIGIKNTLKGKKELKEILIKKDDHPIRGFEVRAAIGERINFNIDPVELDLDQILNRR